MQLIAHGAAFLYNHTTYIWLQQSSECNSLDEENTVIDIKFYF